MILFLLSTVFANTLSDLPICQEQPVECETVYNALPRPTRNPNILRFSDSTLKDTQWLPIHALRLSETNTETATRLALIQLISSMSGEWEGYLLPLQNDEDPQIRAAIAESSKWGSAEYQNSIVQSLQNDSSWEVRSELIRAIGYNQAKQHQDVLIAALNDELGRIRYDAVRVIGWNYLPVDLEILRPLLKDADPMVRMHSLRAIARIYPDSVLNMTELEALGQDDSPMVRNEVQRLKSLQE